MVTYAFVLLLATGPHVDSFVLDSGLTIEDCRGAVILASQAGTIESGGRLFRIDGRVSFVCEPHKSK